MFPNQFGGRNWNRPLFTPQQQQQQWLLQQQQQQQQLQLVQTLQQVQRFRQPEPFQRQPFRAQLRNPLLFRPREPMLPNIRPAPPQRPPQNRFSEVTPPSEPPRTPQISAESQPNSVRHHQEDSQKPGEVDISGKKPEDKSFHPSQKVGEVGFGRFGEASTPRPGESSSSDSTDTRAKSKWTCTRCKGQNWPDRKICFRCKVAKDSSGLPQGDHNNAPSSSSFSNPNPFQQDWKKESDWKCFKCSNVNWTWRDTCNRCQAARNETSSSTNIVNPMFQKGFSQERSNPRSEGGQEMGGGNPLVTPRNPFFSGQQNSNRFSKQDPGTWGQNLRRTEEKKVDWDQDANLSSVRRKEDLGQEKEEESLEAEHEKFAKSDDQWISPPKKQVNSPFNNKSQAAPPIITGHQASSSQNEQDKLLAKEAEFDKMFESWDNNFSKWKEDNLNNPDKEYVQSHLMEMNGLRERMIKRRENLRQKRCQVLLQQMESDQTREEVQKTCRGGGWGSDERRQSYSTYEKFNPQSFERRMDSVSTTTIPGLGDGKDAEVKPPGSEQQKELRDLTQEEREGISRALRGYQKPKQFHTQQSDKYNKNSYETESLFTTKSQLDVSSSNEEENMFERKRSWGGIFKPNTCQEYEAIPNKQAKTPHIFDYGNQGANDYLSRNPKHNEGPKVFEYGTSNYSGSFQSNFSSTSSFQSGQQNPQVFDYEVPKPPRLYPRVDSAPLFPSSSRISPDPIRNIPKPPRVGMGSFDKNEKLFSLPGSLTCAPDPGRNENNERLTISKPGLQVVPGKKVTAEEIFDPPGRYMRSPKITLILRGLPGSGKSHMAKLIKAKEAELGSDSPRVLSLDDYFECDGQYEYDSGLEPSFRWSLIRSFKKHVDDNLFSFLIVDAINEKTEYYKEMVEYANQGKFEVYIADMDCNAGLSASRNVHNRTSTEIGDILKKWEETPEEFNKIDLSGFLSESQSKQSPEEPEERAIGTWNEGEKPKEESEGEEEEQGEEGFNKLSKWELMDNELKKAQLDGVSEKARKRIAEHDSIEDWLELSNAKVNPASGKKRVRWADIEERREQMKMREVGFVVGQTNWNRMLDPSQGESALTRTKIIPNRFQTN